MRTHNSLRARSEYHTQLAKMSFDETFDLTAGVYFHFYNIFILQFTAMNTRATTIASQYTTLPVH